MSVKFKTFFKISCTWKCLLGQRELCCMLTGDNHQNQEESSSGEDALTDSIIKPWLSHDRDTVMSVILVKYWKSLPNTSAKPIAPLARRHFLRITVTQVACDLLSLLLCTRLFTSAFSWTCSETLLSKLWPDRTSCFIQRQTNIQFHCHRTSCLSSSKLRTVWL